MPTPAAAFLFGWGDPPTFREPPMLPMGEPARRRKPKPKPRPLSAAEKQKQDEVLAKAKSGPLLIAVSLNDQELVLYADGVEIARAPVSTGTRGHPTPAGIFSVIQKRRFHRSNLYSNAPMPYMQRITWSGVALHEGVLPGYPASHGCIRMPAHFARLLWRVAKIGARVTVTNASVIPQAFSHPALPTPKPQVAQSASEARPLRIASASNDAGGARAASAADPDSAPVQAPDAPAVTAPDAAPTAAPPPASQPLRPGPISVMVSRKTGRLYVRKGFAPVFDAPITIERPEEPIGTHLFTAMATGEEGPLRWTVLSMPSKPTAEERALTYVRKHGRRDRRHAPASDASLPGAAAALDRIKIPAETRERIAELMSAGASFIVTDHGLGPETGKETDFIVVTR